MSQQLSQERARELLRAKIRAAFPESAFSAAITSSDGLQNEELDEQQALYITLRGRKWSEISPSFIQNYPDGVILLTDEAFAAFLPAWLNCALEHDHVREFMSYTFSPEVHRSMEEMNRRMSQLSPEQKAVLDECFAYIAQIESSKSVREEAYHALAYIRRWTHGRN